MASSLNVINTLFGHFAEFLNKQIETLNKMEFNPKAVNGFNQQ